MITDTIILNLANTLGIALSDIYTIYQEGVMGCAIINIILVLIWLILTAWGYYHFRKIEDAEDSFIFTVILWCVVGFILFGIGDAIKPLLFTEYYAINEMLSTIGSIK